MFWYLFLIKVLIEESVDFIELLVMLVGSICLIVMLLFCSIDFVVIVICLCILVFVCIILKEK